MLIAVLEDVGVAVDNLVALDVVMYVVLPVHRLVELLLEDL